MRRFLCLWLPRWPLERLLAARPELAGETVLLYELSPRGGLKVVEAHFPGEEEGIYRGMPLAEAIALLQGSKRTRKTNRPQVTANGANFKLQIAHCTLQNAGGLQSPPHSLSNSALRIPHSTLNLLPHDPWADRLALIQLAHACQRFSPAAGLEEAERPSSLLLDVTGLAMHFGGEESLLAQVVHDFTARGLTVRAALGDTIGAAWALAHYQMRSAERGMRSDEPQSTRPAERQDCKLPNANCKLQIEGAEPSIPNLQFRTPHSALRTPHSLASLPVAALRLPDETLSLLASLGLRRIGQVEALPRSALRSRFGPELLLRLDQAFGRAPEALRVEYVPPEFVAERQFEAPVDRQEIVELALEQMIAELTQQLVRRHEGVLRLEIKETRNAECEMRNDNGREGKRQKAKGKRQNEEADSPIGKLQFSIGNLQSTTHHSPLTTHHSPPSTLPPPPLHLSLGLFRPSASSKHLCDLVRLQLESLRLREPVSGLRVEATAVGPLMLQQQELFEPERTRQAPQHLAVLVDRLSSRLGRDAVLRPCLLHDAQPEYACVYVPLAGEKAASGHAGVPPSGRRRGGPAKGGTATTSSRSKTAARRARVAGGGDMRLPHERPLSLLPRPVPLEVMALAPQGAPVQFRLAQKNQRDAGPAHRVARSWGPERIETGWWRSGLIRRDYYRVETTQGERYWLFHELASGVWYLQGEFA